MRLISQDKKADVRYEEGSVLIEGPRIYFINAVEKIYLGIYPNGGSGTVKKVMEEIREASLNGNEIFYMPGISYV